MTVNELLLKHSDKIKNINTNLDGNHIITLNDINNENICKKYNINSLNVFSNYGLYYNDNEVIFLYNKMSGIEIISDKSNIGCDGGNVKIECFAIINVLNEDNIYHVIKHKINPLYTFDGCDFNYINNIANIKENLDYNPKNIKICAKYGYCGILYKASLNITQSSNFESDWIEGDEEINDVILEPSKTSIPNSGDDIIISVKKSSVLNLYKKDYFGNITSHSKSPEIITDITNESLLFVNDPFKLSESNHILIPPQKANSSIRIVNITCKYKNFTKSIEIKQEKGPVISYKDFFSFEDGSDNKIFKLENCLESNIKIKLINNKIRYLDGVEFDKINNYGILIKNNDDWLNCDIDYDSMELTININKNDTDYIRTSTITLNNNNKDLYISIYQPKKIEIKCDYSILIDCDEDLYYNTNNNFIITYKPIKKIYYDDDSYETSEYLEPFYRLEMIYNTNDENKILISSPKLVNFNGIYTSKISINNNNKYDDINAEIQCRILDNNGYQIGDVQTKNIIIHFDKPKYKNIEITISVINDSKYSIASSNNCPLFKITDIDNNTILETNISRFWVNLEMNKDFVYLCNIDLLEGKQYRFFIDKYSFLDKETKILNEEYLIENDDEGIDLVISI